MHEQGIRVRYMHSDIETLERIEIIRDLRLGAFDVLIGINLLREGLDIPECGLVAILDADKEGFLRSETRSIQTIGRRAYNEANGITPATIKRDIANILAAFTSRTTSPVEAGFADQATPHRAQSRGHIEDLERRMKDAGQQSRIRGGGPPARRNPAASRRPSLPSPTTPSHGRPPSRTRPPA